MYIQTDSEITYTADSWHPIADMTLCVFFGLLFTVPMGTSYYYDGYENVIRSYSSIVLIIAPSIVGIALAGFGIYRGTRKILHPDQIIISTKGLSYSNLGTVRRYPWSRLGNPIFMPGGRGSACYRIEVTGESKAIYIVPDIFGSFFPETEDVIASARHGTLISVAEARVKSWKADRQMNVVLVPLIVLPLAIMLGIALMNHRPS